MEIQWSPTVNHCSFAFQIVLAMRMKLRNELQDYEYMKVRVMVKEGLHKQEMEINK